MRKTFTRYLRSLDARGKPPTPKVFDEVLGALRGVLVVELKRRGLWNLPPSYIGVYGCQNWQHVDSAGVAVSTARRPQPALNELLVECYTFVFIERLASLRAQLRRKANIDGLVFLNVRNFMFERQRRHDPLGYRVFAALRSALRASVEDGDLYVLEGDAKITNDTVLAARPDLDPAQTGWEGAGEVDLAGYIEKWSDDLLPELVTTRGRGHRAIQVRLRDHLQEFASLSAGPFTFKSLVDPFKTEVRRRWAAVLEYTDDQMQIDDPDREYSNVVAAVRPEAGFEAQESFDSLVDCIDELVERMGDEKARSYLETLWCFLLTRVEDPDSSTEQPEKDGAVAGAWAVAEELPSRRKIAKLLDIPRDRLPSLYELLGGMVQKCQRTVADPIVSGGWAGASRERRG